MNAHPRTAAQSAAPLHWRLHRLLDAPHRLAFAAAALVLAASGLWWATVILLSTYGFAVRWALPPAIAHGVLMTFGFMPLFFAGFLFTAGPKWLARPPVRASSLLPSILAMLCGWGVFVLAAHGRDAAYGKAIGALGMAVVTFGWMGIVKLFLEMLLASKVADRVHAKLVVAGCFCGTAALCAVVAGLAVGNYTVVRAATVSSLWAFIGLVFAVVSHRMIPFFSASAAPALDAWRPLWLLTSLVVVFSWKAIFALAEAFGWAAGLPTHYFVGTCELSAGLLLLALAVRWGLVQSLRIRLLAMLHVGFSWLGMAFVLSGSSRLLDASTGSSLSLGLAPLHAFTMGFLCSTMFAMVTRVSCGHGGRTVAADDFIWRLFWVLQLAVMARLLAPLLSGAASSWAPTFIASAAIGWAGVSVSWALRYGRWFGTPRLDGRPG